MEKTKEERMLEILEKAFTNFKEKMFLEHYTIKKRTIVEDEISILIEVATLIEDVNYLIYAKKQKLTAEKIPNIKGAIAFSDDNNPYCLVQEGGQIKKFTDESYILSRVYEAITKESFKEIVCYEKYGILIKDPLQLEGIYNINVKCFRKGEQ